MTPTLKEEKKLWRKGYRKIAGIDEAGRGPLAGPVVACAVLVDIKRLNPHQPRFSLNRIKDSKKLSAKKREEFYKIITKHPDIEWGIGRVSERVIDRINILEATKLAMERAIAKSSKKPDFLILDGNFKIYGERSRTIPQKSIVKADEKVFSCACASIIAKVTRDRIMQGLNRKYPFYGFDKHKGYPTRLHRKMLKKHGFCKIHRKTFKPVKNLKGLH